LHYDGTTLTKVLEGDDFVEDYHDGINGRIRGVYTDDPDSLWVVTQAGLYRCSKDTQGECFWYGETSDPTSELEVVSGNSHNDFYYAGHFTRMWHYNGSTFQGYQFPDMGTIYGISATFEIMVAVGIIYDTWQGFVIRGYR
tara:strand:- start:9961 stop:10383 length:423 start_codon:yes stop_codon:yes gene_type:complete